jgi:hypothetical protein
MDDFELGMPRICREAAGSKHRVSRKSSHPIIANPTQTLSVLNALAGSRFHTLVH